MHQTNLPTSFEQALGSQSITSNYTMGICLPCTFRVGKYPEKPLGRLGILLCGLY